MKKKQMKKLVLAKETVKHLDGREIKEVAGGLVADSKDGLCETNGLECWT